MAYVKPYDFEPDDRVRALKKSSWCRRTAVSVPGRYSEIQNGIEKYRRCIAELSVEDRNGRYKKAMEKLMSELLSLGEACAVHCAVTGFGDAGQNDVFPDDESRKDFLEELSEDFFKMKSFDAFLGTVAHLAALVRQRVVMRYAACLTETAEGRPYLPNPGLYWMGENRCWYGFNDAGEWVPDYRIPDLDVIEALSKMPKARALLNMELARISIEESRQEDESAAQAGPVPVQEAS